MTRNWHERTGRLNKILCFVANVKPHSEGSIRSRCVCGTVTVIERVFDVIYLSTNEDSVSRHAVAFPGRHFLDKLTYWNGE